MAAAKDKNDESEGKPVEFEKTLARLERVVARLEEGDLPLEEAVKQFEQGMTLLKECHKTLSRAEQKVKILTEKNRNFQLEDFEDHEKK